LAQRKWNILLFSPAYRANTIAGSTDIFASVEKEKDTRRWQTAIGISFAFGCHARTDTVREMEAADWASAERMGG
jgi:hypothetical protein